MTFIFIFQEIHPFYFGNYPFFFFEKNKKEEEIRKGVQHYKIVTMIMNFELTQNGRINGWR